MDFGKDIKKTKAALDKVSSCFCLAKWQQVTVHLQSGLTHSCHHPGTHTIPLDELKKDPAALHDTAYKKQMRKMMLEGKRPPECQYCWNIEDLGPQYISDRHIKSNDEWAKPYLKQVLKQGWTENTKPGAVEVSFSHACNFKCLYCYPHISSSWQKEIEAEGPIQLDFPYHSLDHLRETGKMPIPEEGNPYIEAFWKWLPQIYKTLHVLRLTGGEPILSKHTLKLLDYLAENPNPRLEFAVNSNLGLPTSTVQKFAEKMRAAQQQVRLLRLYTSIDTWGPQAEYIRTGLRMDVFEQNIATMLREIPNLRLTFMCTFNVFSIFEFERFLKKVLEMKQIYSDQGAEILIDISYLRNPQFLSPLLLSEGFASKFRNSLEFMKRNDAKKNRGIGFIEYEIDKMERLVEYFQSGRKNFDQSLHRRQFQTFIVEMDRRRLTKMIELFPMMQQELQSWSSESLRT